MAEGENAVQAAVATGAATDLFVTEAAAERFEEIVRAAGYMDVYTHAITEKAADSLADAWDTKVSVTMGKRKGKIVVEFGDKDDFERIMALIQGTD